MLSPLSARLLLGIYCLLIILLSSRPSLLPPSDGFPLDKLVHFGAYGLMGALAWQARLSNAPTARWLAAALFASLFGVSDELHQAFVPGREASLGDLLADGLGVLCGVWLAERLALALAVSRAVDEIPAPSSSPSDHGPNRCES